MLKKMCLLVLVMLLITGSSAAEDSRLEIQFIVHQGNDESAMTAEALFREDEIVVLSGLFPSFAFSVPGQSSGFFANPGKLTPFDPFSAADIRSAIQSIISLLNSESSDSFYTGDLFDHAETVTEGVLSWYDLLSEIISLNITGKIEKDSFRKGTPEEIFSRSGLPDLSDIYIQYRLFDHGKFLVLNGLESDRTVFTVSFDFSAEDSVSSVFGHAENGTNYYWTHRLSIMSEDEIQLASAMYADIQKEGFRNIMNKEPVLTENWNIRLSANRKDLSFCGTVLPANGKKPVEISGSLSSESRLVFRAKIGFKNLEEPYYTILVTNDHSPVITDHLRTVHLNNPSELTDDDSFSAEVSKNILLFMMKLMQSLPEEYREDLFSMT